MVAGIGTDIIKIDRIREIFELNTETFFEKVYTQKERDQAKERSDPVLYFATRFAGKEAVYKCFEIDAVSEEDFLYKYNVDRKDIRLDEIEILDLESGRPGVSLKGNCAKIASQKGIKGIKISLSYDTDYAIAFVIAQN